MLVERKERRGRRQSALLCGVLACSGLAVAEEVEAPDLEFLEYLGSWQQSEEDWVLVAGAIDVPTQAGQNEDEQSPAEDGETLAEKDDEN